MSTVAFFGFPATGHVQPTLPVVAELVRRGERVHYYTLAPFRAAVERAGATFRDYGSDLPLPSELSNPFRTIAELLQGTQWVLAHRLQEVWELAPDYVVYDSLAPWGSYLAEVLQRPAVCSIARLPINRRMVFTRPSALLRTAWQRFTERRYVDYSADLSAALSAIYLVRERSLFEVLGGFGALNLVYTSRAFQPDAEAFPEARFKFVGPSILPRPDDPPFPFERLGRQPVVYVSLGTAFDDRTDVYRTCLEAFADGAWQVVLAVGPNVGWEALGPLPANAIVRAQVPQLEVLKRAALFVTDGGLSSVSEALSHNVPMVVVPRGADQPWIAQRVADLGAGQQLSSRGLTARRLRRVADQILAEPAYAAAAARIGETLRGAGGYQRAADEIEAFKRSHGLA